MCTEERPYEDTLRKPPYTSQEETSPETKPTDILILDFQPPQLWENKCLLFKSPNPWYSVWQPYQTNTVPKKVLLEDWTANQIALLLKL